MNIKELISVLMESPLYLEIPVVERLDLVKCLAAHPYEQISMNLFDDNAVGVSRDL